MGHLSSWATDTRVAETIFRGAPGGIVVVDMDGMCVAANEAAVRLGLLVPRAAGRVLSEVALPGVVDCVHDALEECRITREPHSAEQILDIAGKETWWLVASTPVHDATGQLTHVIATFFYIDFLKRTEEALRRSEETFRTIIERVPDAIFVLDRKGIRYFNPAAARLIGAPAASDLEDRWPFDLLDAADRHAIRAAWRSAARGGGTRLVEAHVVRPDGRRVTVDFIPIATVFEGRPCALVVARDVTERNELYARLAQADRSIALGTLAAGVAHEINTPLTYVQTNVSYVLERLEEEGSASPEELRQALGDALDGVKRVARTVRELRNLAFGDPSAVTNLDAREILDQIVRLAKPEIERKAKLVLTAGGPVGHVRASTLLSHVFLNLLQNAAQAIPDGAPAQHQVSVHIAPREGGVAVEVSDTGVGIAPETLPRIFDPFFTTKPIGEGMGLGLALAQRIVQVSGGRIVARSDGKGATFEVWLPPAIVEAR